MPEPATPAPRTSARRRRRRRLFVLVALLMVVLFVELGAAVAWWFATGSCFTWGRAAAAREGARRGAVDAAQPVDEQERDAAAAIRRGVMVHPFLGYVADTARADEATFPISSYGFWDAAGPVRRRSDDVYLVGVVGGSVAMQFALFAPDELEAALRRGGLLGDRRLEVVNLALGGFKQPQQLMAVQMVLALGGEFDCVLNIDGFNEVALVSENVPNGVPGWYPRSWARLLDAVPTAEQQRRIGLLTLLREQRRERADAAGTFGWSPLAQFLWLWGDRDLAGRISQLTAEAERSATAPTPAVLGPGTEGRDVPASRRNMVGVWERSSRLLHAVCAANGARYFHFLQPNQYVPDSKPIGPEEAKVAYDPELHWRDAVLDGYPMLLERGAAMRADGVAFTDLTGAFRGHPEAVYTDKCCHFGQRGHGILAELVAGAMRRALELDSVEWRGLEVAPARVELSSPLARAELRVEGLAAGGARHDISGAGFDVRYEASPAGTLHVGADGAVRALRRGRASVRVTHAAGSADVEVAAAWPDLFVGDDAIAPDGGADAPALKLDDEALAAGAAKVDALCSGMVGAPVRLVAVADRPLPDSPIGLEAFGLLLVPVVGDADVVRVEVPVSAPAGRPVFVRYYALDAKLGTVLAASPTVVVTRG